MTQKGTTITIPKLVNGRGTYPIRRTYTGIGEIRVSSGTTDPNTYVKIVQAMDDLANVGNLTTLQSIRDKVVTPIEVLHSVKNTGVNTVLAVNNALTIKTSVDEWLETHSVKESSKKGYRSHLAGFYKTIKDTDTIRELPVKLDKYRKVCQKKGTSRSFNQVRAALMAYTRSTFKKKSQLYQDVKDVDVLPVTPKLDNDAVPVTTIAEFCSHLTKEHSDIVWSLCFSGMRIGEYMSQNDVEWKTDTDRLIVLKNNPGHGNKGYSRIAILPFTLSTPERGHKALRKAIWAVNKTIGTTITPHTFRKCFSHWADEAGISQARLDVYMGHTTKTISDLYKKHEVDIYLQDDADKFRTYVADQLNPPKPKKTIKMIQMGPMGMEEVDIEVQ